MTAPFDPPAGDEGLLRAAVQSLGALGGDLSSDFTDVRTGVKTAVAVWSGAYFDDFRRCGGGVQVQVHIAGDGCSQANAALSTYLSTYSQACSDIASWKTQADTVRTNAQAAADKITNPADDQIDAIWQHAGSTMAHYESLALEAKSGLVTAAGRAAAALDTLTDKIVPVSSALTATEISAQVDGELGISGDPTLGPWAMLTGAMNAAPPGAVNADGTVDLQAALATPTPPAAGTSPADVAAWWSSLSPTEQDAALRLRAGEVGNLDGIPVVDRDFANRIDLVAIRTSLSAQLAKAKSQEPAKYTYEMVGYTEAQVVSPAWKAWNSEVGGLQTRLDGMNDVAAIVDRNECPAPYFLIGLQDVGHGRAIISSGNPDYASNVATYVPGMGTNLTGIQGGVDRSTAMYNSAQVAGSTSTAVVTWYGYDAPQSLGPAASEDDAEAAAPLLDSFATGLRVTHADGAFQSTVVAHSYGTTVTGYAASHGNDLDVDDIVFVASPGVTVDSAGDLHLTGDETGSSADVYATTAEYDPIRLAEGINGGAPVDTDFGSHTFHSDADRGHLYLLGWNSSAHSAYWNAGTPSLRSIGMIIAGHGQQTS